MTKEQLIELLKRHRFNQSVLALAQRNIRDIKVGINTRVEKDVIESMAIGGTKFGDIPPSVTNKFNSLTENAALGYKDKITVEDINALEWICQLEADALALQDEIHLIQALLKGLKSKNKFVIRMHYFDGIEIKEICPFYLKKYHIPYVHYNTIDNKRNEGINTMLKACKHMRI